MRSFFKSFAYATNGLRQIIFSERNFIIHIVAAFFAIALAVLLKVNDIELMIVILCIVLVMAFEIMNTAVEKLCDFIHPGKHENIKLIKDIAAAAVLVVSLGALVIGIIIFVPRLIALF